MIHLIDDYYASVDGNGYTLLRISKNIVRPETDSL